MDERLVELIIAIVDRLVDSETRSETVESITQSLMTEGYNAQEVNTAFMWLYHTVDESFFEDGRIIRTDGSIGTVRVLNDFERTLITPEAYGYILQLSQLGLLDNLQIEEVIDRAMYSCGDMVELNDVKRIVPSIIIEGVPGFRPGLISWRNESEGSVPH
jgi:Smg protein